jgi:hypothetical protein
MALTTASGFGLSADSRFKRWGKLVRGPQDIDLQKRNGYSLTGPFVRWGEAVALEPGQFLVLAAESGSIKHHDYDYRLVGVNAAGEAEAIDPYPVLDEAHLPDAVRAKVANSALYTIAAYCWVQYQTGAAPPQPQATSVLESLWQQIQALPEAEQVELRNRLLHAL